MSSDSKAPEENAASDEAADDEPTAAQWFAMATIVIAPLVLIAQGIYWLIHRVWPPLPVSRLFEWVGLPVPSFGRGEWGEKLDMVLGAPISLVLFVLSFIVVITVINQEKEEARAGRPKLVKLMKRHKKSKPSA